jgi:ABC-2 type transport system permease protein
MPSGSHLQPNKETGWQRGFKQLLARENGGWWKSRRWIVQILIYLLVLNGILLTVLNAPGGSSGQASVSPAEKVAQAVSLFIVLAGLFPVISVVIIGQDTIIGEKQSGTAAWILSKPVSRPAFVLAKLIAHSLAFFVNIAVIQGLVAYIILSSAKGQPLPVPSFIGGILLIFLNLLFYITLTLMLGVLFEQRGGVIGIGLALALGYQIITGVAPWTLNIMPWGLIGEGGLASEVMLGQTPQSYLPLIATIAWCLVFTIVALWRFEKAEF